jgi:hypothetical protein
MKRWIAVVMILLILTALPLPATAAGETAGPDNTGDLFGVVIVLLLVSAIAVALLVLGKTRFVQDDCNNAGGR